MKIKCTVSYLLITLSACAQPKMANEVKNLEGIWIAETYLQMFDQTRSSLKSKGAFPSHYPAGLRVNSLELRGDSLIIGYGVLHDHSLYPETSTFLMADGERIYEQGYFMLNALKPDSLNFYKISETQFFNYECDAYFSWQYGKDTCLLLYRPASAELPEKTIRYKRITDKFLPDNPFPNPVYYYTRSKTLAGNFILKDGHGKILSTRVSIGLDGQMRGYTSFDSLRCYFSTDVYCGPHEMEDVVLNCSIDKKYDFKCKGYYYNSIKGGGFQLLDREWKVEDDEYKVGAVKFNFIRL
jgi:hypothetical protein